MFLLLPWCLALALAVSLSPIAEANTDTQGWVHVGGRYLKFYATPMNWADAQATCRSVGGLVVYDDNAAVNAYLARNGKLQWIGANDRGHEGKWTLTSWSKLAPGASPHWYPGEPNNCCGGQNCAVVNFKKPGLWDDQECWRKRPFHCQVHRLGYQYVASIGRRVLKVHPEKKTWAAAQSVCHAEGGQLVIVNSKATNDWLAKQTLNNIWIGATDNGHEGKWTTPDGSLASKDFWYKGEPNNCCGGQNCAVVNFLSGKYGGKGTWDDQGCGIARSFVCEIML